MWAEKGGKDGCEKWGEIRTETHKKGPTSWLRKRKTYLLAKEDGSKVL